jgi:predicted transcriptional regulator
VKAKGHRDLFDAYARSTDPETSHAAAASLEPELPRLESAVHRALQAAGKTGCTTHELAVILNMSLVTVSPRIAPLVRKNLVVKSAKRRCAGSGRPSIVWVATPQ